MPEVKKNTYVPPSVMIQQVSQELKEKGTPLSAVDISIMTSFQILDKLDELVHLMRYSLTPKVKVDDTGRQDKKPNQGISKKP